MLYQSQSPQCFVRSRELDLLQAAARKQERNLVSWRVRYPPVIWGFENLNRKHVACAALVSERTRSPFCHNSLRSLVASRSVNRKRRRYGIGRVVPAAVEAHAVVAAACGNAAVIAEIIDGYIGTTLGLGAIPDLGDRLTVGKGPSQSPAGDSSRSCVVNGDRGTKSPRPLVGYGVDDVAGEAALKGADRHRDRGGRSQSARRARDGHSGRSGCRRARGRQGENTGAGRRIGDERSSDSAGQAGSGESDAAGESADIGHRDRVGGAAALCF